MRLRDRAITALLALVLVVLTGAVVAPSLAPETPVDTPVPSLVPAGSYVEGVVGSAASASPFGARSSAERAMVALLFRGLVRLGPGETVLGDLAESWSVDAAGTTWTFHLRPDLAWQDGAPLTSADVVYTIDTLNDPTYTGPGAGSWSGIGVTAPDPLTVVMTLPAPLGGFLEAATQPIAPQHLLEGEPAADLAADGFGRAPVGSGTFRLAALDSVHAVLLPAVGVPAQPDAGDPGEVTPRPTDSLATAGPTPPGGDPLPYLDGIELRFFPDDAALAEAWDRGELDGASGLSGPAAASLAAGPDSRLLRYPTTTLLGVTLNLMPGRTPFSDPDVRRALLQAIDRQAIITKVFGGLAVEADSPIPPSSWAFDPAADTPVPYNPDAARAALAKAGWKEGPNGGWTPAGATAPLTLDLLSPAESSNLMLTDVTADVAANWRAIGFDVNVTALPVSSLVTDRLRTGDFSAVVLGFAIGLDPDLYPFLASTQTTTTGSNLSGMQNPALDALLIAARSPGSVDDRRAAYTALETQLSAGTYLLPIAFRDEPVVVRSTLTGPEIRPIGGPGDRFWDVLTWRLASGR